MLKVKPNFSIKVLYVEDEDVIRNAVSFALEKFYTCISAANGLEALEIFENSGEIFDLIVTDINMPKLDGLQMSKKIKNNNPNIPIILTTAHYDQDFLFQSIELGINHYVVKPLNVLKLIETIDKTIEPIVLKRVNEEKEKNYQKQLLEQTKFVAIGQLAAGITHEINTPLTYMKSSFELIAMDINDLEESKIKDSIKEDLSRIEDGFLRIENIIQSMKEMISSTKEEKIEINIYETLLVSLNMAYNKFKHITNIYINGNKFVLNMDKNEYTYFAKINPERIEQVWIIIINNALDELVKINNFDDRKFEIEITCDKDAIFIKFIDNAGGIKEEIIDKIFEPFKSTKESSGMGIGLNIADRIIKSHQGEIKAYNQNDGAVFEVKIPINPK